jgi:hypothetical protein
MARWPGKADGGCCSGQEIRGNQFLSFGIETYVISGVGTWDSYFPLLVIGEAWSVNVNS